MIIRTKTKHTRRRHLRLQLTPAVAAELTLDSIGGQAVETRSRPVLLLDISQGGLRFMSVLDLPVSMSYTLRLTLGAPVPMELKGHVRWKRRRDNFFEYGIAYAPAPAPSLQHKLIRLLNGLLLQQSPSQATIHSLYRQISGQKRC